MLEEPVTSSVKGKSMDMLRERTFELLKQGSPAPGLWPVRRGLHGRRYGRRKAWSVIFAPHSSHYRLNHPPPHNPLKNCLPWKTSPWCLKGWRPLPTARCQCICECRARLTPLLSCIQSLNLWQPSDNKQPAWMKNWQLSMVRIQGWNEMSPRL